MDASSVTTAGNLSGMERSSWKDPENPVPPGPSSLATSPKSKTHIAPRGWSRRKSVACLLGVIGVASACRGSGSSAAIPDPPATTGGWQRTALETSIAGPMPEELASLKPEGWLRASYEKNPLHIDVEICHFSSQTVAFEAWQRFRKGQGRTCYYRGPFFVFCTTSNAGAELVPFATALEAQWPKPEAQPGT